MLIDKVLEMDDDYMFVSSMVYSIVFPIYACIALWAFFGSIGLGVGSTIMAVIYALLRRDIGK